MKKATAGIIAAAHAKPVHQVARNGTRKFKSAQELFQELNDPTTCQEAFAAVSTLVTNGGTGPERENFLFHAVKFIASRPSLFSNEQFSSLANQAMLNEIFSEEQKELFSEMIKTRLRVRRKGAKARVEVEDGGRIPSSMLFQQLKDPKTCQAAYEIVLKLVTNGVSSKVDLFNAVQVIATKPELFSDEQISIIAGHALKKKIFSENQRKLFFEMKKKSPAPLRTTGSATGSVPALGKVRASAGNEATVHRVATHPISVDQAATFCDRSISALFQQLNDPAVCQNAYKMALKLLTDGGSVPGSRDDIFNAVTIIASKPELFSNEQVSFIAGRALLNETFSTDQKKLLSLMKNQSLERIKGNGGEIEVNLRAVKDATINMGANHWKPIDQAEDALGRSNSALFEKLKDPSTCQEAYGIVLELVANEEPVPGLVNAVLIIASKPQLFSNGQLSAIASRIMQNKTWSDKKKNLISKMVTERHRCMGVTSPSIPKLDVSSGARKEVEDLGEPNTCREADSAELSKTLTEQQKKPFSETKKEGLGLIMINFPLTAHVQSELKSSVVKEVTVDKASTQLKPIDQGKDASGKSNSSLFQKLKDPNTRQEAYQIFLKLAMNGKPVPGNNADLFNALKFVVRQHLCSDFQFCSFANRIMQNKTLSKKQNEVISAMVAERYYRMGLSGPPAPKWKKATVNREAACSKPVEQDEDACTELNSDLVQDLEEPNTCQEAGKIVLKLVRSEDEQLSIVADGTLVSKQLMEKQKLWDRSYSTLLEKLENPNTCQEAYETLLKLVTNGGVAPDVWEAIQVISRRPQLFSYEQFSIITNCILQNKTYSGKQKKKVSFIVKMTRRQLGLTGSNKKATWFKPADQDDGAFSESISALFQEPKEQNACQQADSTVLSNKFKTPFSETVKKVPVPATTSSPLSAQSEVNSTAVEEAVVETGSTGIPSLPNYQAEYACSTSSSALLERQKEPDFCQQAGTAILSKTSPEKENKLCSLVVAGRTPATNNVPLSSLFEVKSAIVNEATEHMVKNSLPFDQAEDAFSTSNSSLLQKLKEPTTCQEAFNTVIELLANARSVHEVTIDLLDALEVIASNSKLYTDDQISTLAGSALLSKMFSKKQKTWISELMAKTLAEMSITEASSELEAQSSSILEVRTDKTATYHLTQLPVKSSSHRNAVTERNCNAGYRFGLARWWEAVAKFCFMCGRTDS
ncbi:hypothetical protein R1flu_004482 [Riccia fluitans]|uniref:Uncharacterized protein n=1 Tax=Riccia fluitans TaxID=41844 RepID=A0ABD1YQF4_9MARC